MSLHKLMLGLAVSAIGLWASGAEAGWRHGSSGGSWGSWGSSGSHGSWGSSGGSWGSSGSHGSWGSHGSSGSSGSHGGFFRRLFHSSGGSHGSWGSSGSHGSSGSWGSSGSHGSWGSSGGSSGGSYGSSGGSYGSSGGTVVYGDGAVIDGGNVIIDGGSAAPANGDAPAGDAGEGAELPNPDAGANMTSASLIVKVPADAKVFVNDLPTTSTGAERRYVSNGLEQGRVYSYTIRAEMVRDGQTVSETKTVKVRVGQNARLAFNLKTPETRTTLVVHVPENAKVFLAGKETKAAGTIREFSTTRLVKGGEWASYPIRVEITRDGETLVKEETVSLAAGETREVNFDFDAPQVASK